MQEGSYPPRTIFTSPWTNMAPPKMNQQTYLTPQNQSDLPQMLGQNSAARRERFPQHPRANRTRGCFSASQNHYLLQVLCKKAVVFPKWFSHHPSANLELCERTIVTSYLRINRIFHKYWARRRMSFQNDFHATTEQILPHKMNLEMLPHTWKLFTQPQYRMRPQMRLVA